MNTYKFDCWFKDDGIPKIRYIDAENERKAIETFEDWYPDMGYDYPYL